MTERLLVPTDFEDISELAQGLADRVDDGRLMLYGPEPFPDGVPVHFSVLLQDRTAALEGMGRSVVSIDGGEDRDPGVRYDIVLEQLELEGMAEAVYERILMARHSAVTAIAVDQHETNGGGDWQHAEAVHQDMPQPRRSGILSRPGAQPAWRPSAEPEPNARPSTGLFQHGSHVPIPRSAPRPDIDPSLRVARAASPQNGSPDHEATRTDVELDAGTEEMVHDLDTQAVELPAEEMHTSAHDGGHAIEEPGQDGSRRKKKRRR